MSMEYIQGVQDKVTRNEVTKQIRVALAGELNANHNLGMQIAMIEGHLKEEIRKQLKNFKKHEDEHAMMLINRIIELGGNPDIRPMQWDSLAVCDYRPITSTDQKAILEIAYQTKKCKSAFYSKLLQFLEPKDRTSYDIITRILEDEYEDMGTIKDLEDKLVSANERVQNGTS